MAQQVIDSLNGRLAAGPNLNPSGEKSRLHSMTSSQNVKWPGYANNPARMSQTPYLPLVALYWTRKGYL
jgi:hypothetical protein